MSGMKVLVPGGAGFIGSHVVEALLTRQHEVTVVDDFNDFYDPALKRRNLAGVNARIIEADIRTKLPVEKFDVIIHLAARAGVRPSLAQPRLYSDVNIAGTQNLLEFACETGVKKFIF